jgi:hypothetical protein
MKSTDIDGPAKILPTHIRDRNTSRTAGAGKAWRNVDWPIQAAFEAGRLTGQDRLDAIVTFAGLAATAEIRSTRDSTQLDIVRGGNGDPISEHRADAIKKHVSIQSLMPPKDRKICNMLADGHKLHHAIETACGPDYGRSIAARVTDALDALLHAMRVAKHTGYRVDLTPLAAIAKKA